jgi:osmoprotectant transport system permease protein
MIKILLVLLIAITAQAQEIVIGSKTFTESYVLGELAKRAAEERGLVAIHKQGMGGTIILWQALQSGAIAAYPDYTGTITEEILKQPQLRTYQQIEAALAHYGVGITKPLGFNNTYAMGLDRKKAAAKNITKISDLRSHPELRLGLTHEFLGRADGWKPLSQRYGLEAMEVAGMDHALSYAAVRSGEIDVIDVYSTDAKIAEYDLVVLEDDLGFFPRYDAVFLYRKDLPLPFLDVLEAFGGKIPEAKMIQMNAEAERTKNYAAGAALYFGSEAVAKEDDRLVDRTLSRTGRHLQLVVLSLLLSIITGIPLGILAYRYPTFGGFVLGITGIVQTIPSLALLAILVTVPFLGISIVTAIIALFLYGLLPIVRSTATGLEGIPRSLRESAEALGLSPSVQMRKIYLPLASRQILSGIKTSAVINVGTATLAALIGAGGLGEPILSGLNLNDTPTILEGAVPAAILALLVEVLFLGADRIFIPKGLRIERHIEL